MKASDKHVLRLGGVDCRLLQYDVLPKLPLQAAALSVSQNKTGTRADVPVRSAA